MRFRPFEFTNLCKSFAAGVESEPQPVRLKLDKTIRATNKIAAACFHLLLILSPRFTILRNTVSYSLSDDTIVLRENFGYITFESRITSLRKKGHLL